MPIASLSPWLRVPLTIGIVLLIGLLLITLFQKRLIYFPDRASEETLLQQAKTSGLEPWHNADGALIGWKSPSPDSLERRLLVFHGNAGFALHRDHLRGIAPENWQVLILEYPGYGSRDGSPEEGALKAAALEALNAISSPDAPPIYLAGESLGTGVACWLAGKRPDKVAGVLLISPMTTMVDVAQEAYPWLPVRLLLTERYNSVAAMANYPGKVAVVVGAEDRLIRPEISQNLFDSLSDPKRLWIQEARATILSTTRPVGGVLSLSY